MSRGCVLLVADVSLSCCHCCHTVFAAKSQPSHIDALL